MSIIMTFRIALKALNRNKMRTILTMLGMIFGVGAVISMLSIGAGAKQEALSFIEQLGVRNVIVEARETTDPQAFGKVRRTSPGLTFQDYRLVAAFQGHHHGRVAGQSAPLA